MLRNSLAGCAGYNSYLLNPGLFLRLLVKVDKSHGNPIFPWVGAPWSVLPKSLAWFEPVTTASCSAHTPRVKVDKSPWKSQ